VKLVKLFSSNAARDTTLEQLAHRCERWVVRQYETKAYRTNPRSFQKTD